MLNSMRDFIKSKFMSDNTCKIKQSKSQRRINLLNNNTDKYITKLARENEFHKKLPNDLIMLTEKEYCQITYEKLATVRANRIKGKGCGYYKIGGHVRYKLSEVITYIESCSKKSTSQ